MSNYVEYDGSVAFHPGYYLNELVEDSGLTQEDFARRLATTPKNLSLLIRGKQRLSVDMAVKLSRMIGTSANYWLNLQNEYDIMLANMAAKAELKDELEVLRLLGYNYFRDSFGLPDLPRQLEEQVKCVRGFLGVASLKALRNRDWAVSFRESREGMSESNIVKANAMVQIAVNEALQTKAPKFNRSKFVKSVDYATTQTKNHAGFYPLVR